MGWKKSLKKAFRKTLAVATYGLSEPIWKNWSSIRTPLAYAGAGALIASGIGAGLGVAGLTGLTVAGSAAAGAATGGIAGGTTGVAANETQKAAERADKEKERIAAEEAEAQRRLSLQRAGATPDAVTDLNTEARRRMRSQAQRNMVSRNNAKKLGGSSSTLA